MNSAKKLNDWKLKNAMIDPVDNITWRCLAFNELSTDQLFELLKLRQDIFVLEQQCLYPDIDEKDRSSHHLLGYYENSSNLVAYLRIVCPGMSYREPSLGRVAVAKAIRRNGMGEILVERGVQELRKLYPDTRIQIGAQYYLKQFYESAGFETSGETYLEDGIPHIDMIKN